MTNINTTGGEGEVDWSGYIDPLIYEIQTMLNVDLRDAMLAILRVAKKVDPDQAWSLIYAMNRIAGEKREWTGTDQEAWKGVYRITKEILYKFTMVEEPTE